MVFQLQIITSDKFATASSLYQRLRHKGLVGVPSAVAACSLGNPVGFGVRAQSWAGDGSSFDQAENADPYCTCQYQWGNIWPMNRACLRSVLDFVLQFDGFTSTELFTPCTNLCFAAV